MCHFILPSSKKSELFECEVHKHASGQHSIVIDGYRFLLPEARSFESLVEHLEIFQEAFERGIHLVGCVPSSGNDEFVFYDPEKDIPL